MGDRVRVEHLGQITGDADSTNAGPWYISGAFEPDCLERLDGLRKSLAQDMRRPTAVRRYADPRSAARAGDFGRAHDTQIRAHTNTRSTRTLCARVRTHKRLHSGPPDPADSYHDLELMRSRIPSSGFGPGFTRNGSGRPRTARPTTTSGAGAFSIPDGFATLCSQRCTSATKGAASQPSRRGSAS